MYDHFHRAPRTQTHTGVHRRPQIDEHAVVFEFVFRIRRVGPLLVVAHVDENSHKLYQVLYRKYPLPPRPSRALHFAGFGL